MFSKNLLKMTLIPPTRKRNRSCEEEDFLPLSKKINNLHINNWGNLDTPQEQLLKWSNSSNQFLSLYPSDIENGNQENESRNSSPFKGPQQNLQNGYNETEINGHYKHLNNESYKDSNYTHDNGESCSNGDRVENWSRVYNPDLGAEENPYYYESNKLLFNLYVERLQRGGF